MKYEMKIVVNEWDLKWITWFRPMQEWINKWTKALLKLCLNLLINVGEWISEWVIEEINKCLSEWLN